MVRRLYKMKLKMAYLSIALIYSALLGLFLFIPDIPARENRLNKNNVTLNKNNVTSIALNISLSLLKEEKDLIENLEKLSSAEKCRRMVTMGGDQCMNMDGQKYVCLDERLWDQTLPCVVYSFGIANETSFEEEFVHFRKNCEIHLFDPTIKPNERNFLINVESETYTGRYWQCQRSAIKKEYLDVRLENASNVHFHEFGIARREMELKLTGVRDSYRMLTLESIVKQLEHETFPISYLKLDVEGYEWQVFENLLKGNLLAKVMQMSVEIHLKTLLDTEPRDQWLHILQEKYNLLLQLERSGRFGLVSMRPNYAQCTLPLDSSNSTVYPLCAELHYVKP